MFQFQEKEISFPYTVFVEHRTTFAIAVFRQHVYVYAPMNATPIQIQLILKRKAKWIVEQLQHFHETPIHEEAIRLPYQGRFYRLHVIREQRDDITFQFYRGKFVSYVPSEIQNVYEAILPYYKQWVSEKGIQWIAQFLAEQQLQLKIPHRITIQLPWSIFTGPKEVAQLAIFHHLLHLNEQSSTTYRERVARAIPQFEIANEWINSRGNVPFEIV